MKRIFIDADKCEGCKNCSVACMLGHDSDDNGNVYSLDLKLPQNESRNTILRSFAKQNIPLFCRHCDKPGCAEACMSGAMVKDAAGYVRYDKDKCAKCFMCVMSCSFGVLKVDRATGTYVVKCDFCKEHGDEPSCAKMCPKKAIHVEEV